MEKMTKLFHRVYYPMDMPPPWWHVWDPGTGLSGALWLAFAMIAALYWDLRWVMWALMAICAAGMVVVAWWAVQVIKDIWAEHDEL